MDSQSAALGYSVGLTRHTDRHNLWSVLPLPAKNQPAMKFPTVPIVSPGWKHLCESKWSSITPPSGVLTSWKWFQASACSSTLIINTQKTFFFPIYSCTAAENISSKQACPGGVLHQTKLRDQDCSPKCSTEHWDRFISFLTSLLPHSGLFSRSPSSYAVLFLLQDLTWCWVLTVLTSSLNTLTRKIQPAWLFSVYFPSTPIPCRLILEFC